MVRSVRLPAGLARTLKLFTEAWNTDDAEERERLVRASCSADLAVVSPYGLHRGIRAQCASIAEVRARFPRLRTGGSVLGVHHRIVLSSWWTTFGGSHRALTGIDCYEFDSRGKVTRVVSFSPVSPPEGPRGRPAQLGPKRSARASSRKGGRGPPSR